MPGFDIGNLIPDIVKVASNVASTAAKTAVDIKDNSQVNQATRRKKPGFWSDFMTAMGNNAGNRELVPVAPAKTAAWLYEHEQDDETPEEDQPSYYGDYVYNKSGYTKGDLADLEPKVFSEQRSDAEKQQHQAAYDSYLDQRDENMREFASNQSGSNIGLSQGNFGAALASDEDRFKIEPDDDLKWDRLYGEHERRTGGDSVLASLLSPTSSMITPEPVRDVYEDYFSDLDSRGIRDEDALSKGFTNENISKNLVDDGYSPGSRESQFMTGEQYIRYIQDVGIPGRDIRDIDPDMLYNKQDEAENYGFIPYITSEHNLREYRTGANSTFVSNLFDNLANSRKIISDAANGEGPFGYRVKTDSGDIDGWELEKRRDIYQKTRPLPDIDDIHFLGYETPTENSSLVGYYVTFKDNPDIPVNVRSVYSDGTIVLSDDRVISEDDPNLRSFYPDIVHSREDAENAMAWTESVPPLVLESGVTLKPDELNFLQEDMENGTADVDYGFAGLGMPDADVEHFWRNPAPAIWDMMAMSAPYFHPVTSFANAFGGVMQNGRGIATQRDMNDAYSMIAEDPTNDQLYGATVGSAIMPLTEMLWGPLGGFAFGTGPTRKIVQTGANKIGKALGRADDVIPDELATRRWMSYLFGLSDEGFEEVPGNIAEHIQSDGFQNWYADKDERGKMDRFGNLPYKETPWLERIGKFWGDAPSSYAAGAVLGSMLGGMNKNYYDKIRKGYIADEIARRLTEDSMEKPDNLLDPEKRSQDYINQFPSNLDVEEYEQLSRMRNMTDEENAHHDMWSGYIPRSLFGYQETNELEDEL